MGISLKFGGIPLMLCGLFSREVSFRERVNLAHVRYITSYPKTPIFFSPYNDRITYQKMVGEGEGV